MITNFLKKISVVSLLLLLLPLHPTTANAVTENQNREIRICYARATLYEVFANRYIKGFTKRQSINSVKSIGATPDATRKTIKVVKTTYRDKPGGKFQYALGKLQQCHQNNVSIVNQRVGALCYSLKGVVEVINNAKKSGKTYEQTMAIVSAAISNKSMISLVRTMGRAVYNGSTPVRKLQKNYYLACVKTALGR
ncbi:MAG TPA: hypothetical protein ENG78_07260 [Acidiferrobacteraceae bacterium]|nr:hypothetical protein [Acidiferrobacteraceae bacterium]HEX20599.1 hypothetical protein [Acidiferrobacteraceae bacterium]